MRVMDRRSNKEAMRGWMLLEAALMKSNDHRLNVADLFSAVGGSVGPDGTPNIHAGWSTAARDRGHNVIGYDWDQHKGKPIGILPDKRVNILNLTADQMIDDFGGPIDLLFASGPCEGWSMQQIGNTWKTPEQWKVGGRNLKRELNMLRGTDEEYPEDLAAGWEPKNQAAVNSQRTMQRTFDLMEDLREYNPDMKAFIENPVSVLRYHPTSFGDWDMANIQHASYQDPASSELFGITDFSPLLPQRMHVGGGGIPELKPTDLWGHFPKDWTPRPRLKGAKDPLNDILYGSNVLYNDMPGAGGQRNLQAHELKQLLSQGGSKDFKERLSHAPELSGEPDYPQLTDGKYWRSKPRGKSEGQWEEPKSIRTGQYGNQYYAAAPPGARAGINELGPITFTNRAGRTVTAPPYFTRSLIPYGEGLDAILATEKEHGLSQSPLGQAVVSPKEVIENFMRR